MKTNILLAQLILQSAMTHESSFDRKAASAATEKLDAEREAHYTRFPESTFYGAVDYNRFYTLTLYDAVYRAAEASSQADLVTPVYLLLAGTWNEAIKWAQEVLHLHPQKYFYQDGADFYDAKTGDLIASYPDLVALDALDHFYLNFPHYKHEL